MSVKMPNQLYYILLTARKLRTPLQSTSYYFFLHSCASSFHHPYLSLHGSALLVLHHPSSQVHCQRHPSQLICANPFATRVHQTPESFHPHCFSITAEAGKASVDAVAVAVAVAVAACSLQRFDPSEGRSLMEIDSQCPTKVSVPTTGKLLNSGSKGTRAPG